MTKERMMGRTILAAVLAFSLSHGGTAAASSGEPVRYSAVGCTETVLLLPPAGGGAPPTLQLSVLVYRCDSAIVDGRLVAPFLVSEIGTFDADGGQRLLRHVSNDGRLAARLERLGFPASFSSRMRYDVSSGSVSASIPVRGDVFTMTAAIAASPLAPERSGATGATYVNRTEEGATITLAYVSDRGQPVPGGSAGTIDASRDPELAGWLGSSISGGAGIHQTGDWSATGYRGSP